ncbi:MAG: hypothetical protein AB1589_12995 [Cyanobacteriota bacterium]
MLYRLALYTALALGLYFVWWNLESGISLAPCHRSFSPERGASTFVYGWLIPFILGQSEGK